MFLRRSSINPVLPGEGGGGKGGVCELHLSSKVALREANHSEKCEYLKCCNVKIFILPSDSIFRVVNF